MEIRGVIRLEELGIDTQIHENFTALGEPVVMAIFVATAISEIDKLLQNRDMLPSHLDGPMNILRVQTLRVRVLAVEPVAAAGASIHEALLPSRAAERVQADDAQDVRVRALIA